MISRSPVGYSISEYFAGYVNIQWQRDTFSASLYSWSPGFSRPKTWLSNVPLLVEQRPTPS